MKPPEPALRQVGRQWLDKATADSEAAEQLSAQGGRFREIVAIHCQQAVEKYLKALLVQRQVEFPKTHDIANGRRPCRILPAARPNSCAPPSGDSVRVRAAAARRTHATDQILI